MPIPYIHLDDIYTSDEPIIETTGRQIEFDMQNIIEGVQNGVEVDPDWLQSIEGNYETARDLFRSQYKEWMKLIINGLLIIDSGGVEAQRAYSAAAPAHLAEKALSGRPGAAKAHKKLKASGFVNLKRYEVPNQARQSTGSDGRMISPHWRRGHWRRVHYGPGKNKTKRVRIAPTIVMGKGRPPTDRDSYKIGE